MASVKGVDLSANSHILINDVDSEGSDEDGNKSEEEDEKKLLRLEEELERLAHDPNLLSDLM